MTEHLDDAEPKYRVFPRISYTITTAIMASWSRVAAGLQRVAEEAAKQAATQVATVGTRTSVHGWEVLASAQTASAAAAASFVSQQQQQQQYYGGTPTQASHYGQPMNGHGPQPNPASSVPLPPVSSKADDGTQTVHGLTPNELPSDPNQSVTRDDASVYQASPLAPSPDGSSSLHSERYKRLIDVVPIPSPVAPHSDTAEREDRATSTTLRQDPPINASLHLSQLDHLPHLLEGRPVPSTRIGRAAGFAQLGAGLALGAAAEGFSRLFGAGSGGASSPTTSILVNDANSDRLASSLCRMRGAALKMGQMLSIQDESLLPPALQRALKQVRQGAEAMPKYQLLRQLESQLGPDWCLRFVSFDERPFAAASIGQVHRAQVRRSNGTVQDVVVKVQYPGVGRSIESDLRNLAMLVKWTGMAPKGLFLDNVIRVGQQELSVECDYKRELLNQRRIRQLVESDPVLRENRFVVPDVIDELCTDEILTSEYRHGGTIDKVSDLDQEERNRIARTIMYLTMKELFVWRFMQTDPNWGNFLYDVGTGTTSLIDFGATREYSKSFVDGYLRIVWASANREESALMEQSYRMHFLTGDENDEMLRAHKLSGYTVGEPFHNDEPFDFRGSSISTRMGEHTSVFLRHRLTPPPEEVYTLHRKLAGAYMLCIKLGAVIQCRDMLETIVANHTFDDGLEPLVV